MAETHIAQNAKISGIIDLHLPPEESHCWCLELLIYAKTKLTVD